MIVPTRAVERSLTAAASEETLQTRYAELATVKNPLKRLSLQRMQTFVCKHPGVTAKLFDLKLPRTDLEVIGEGTQSKVYRNAGMVLKVLDGSLELTKGEQQTQAEDMQYEHNALLAQLGSCVVPHAVFVGAHPFMPRKTAIQILQPHKPLLDTGIFVMGNPVAQIGAIDRLISANPTVGGQLADFAANGLALYDRTGLAPDSNGQGNFGIDTHDNIALRDAQPVTKLDAAGQELILNQLQSLAGAV